MKFTAKQIRDAGYSPALVYYPTTKSVFHRATHYGYYDTLCNLVQANEVSCLVEGMARELCKSGCWTNEEITRLETLYDKKEVEKIGVVGISRTSIVTVSVGYEGVREGQNVTVEVLDDLINLTFGVSE